MNNKQVWWDNMTYSHKQTQPGLSFTARIARWWAATTPARRRVLFMRGTLGVACSSAVLIGMPVLSTANLEQQDAQQFRERNQQLAIAQDAGVVLRADQKASPLLRHDWLRSVEYSLERDPASALSRYAALERDRAALNGLQTLEIGAMSRAENMVAETKCLAEAVYYEARSERKSGQLAVAEVIMNRVKDHRYPNSVCDVVYQGATRTTGCQFTFTCDGATDRAPRGVRWEAARTVASHVMMGLNEEKTSGATHYHATYVNPVWNSGLVRTRQIGTHIFYRFPRGSEWAAASAKQSRRLAQRRAGLSAITPAVASGEREASVVKTSGELASQTPQAGDQNSEALESIEAAGSVEVAPTTTTASLDDPRLTPTAGGASRIADGSDIEVEELPVAAVEVASDEPTSTL